MQTKKTGSECILYLSTYPPRECGIATFTKDLTDAIDELEQGVKSRIAAVNNDRSYDYDERVKCQLEAERQEDYLELSAKINSSEDIRIVSIQHEYGIFGGKHGSYLLPFMEGLQKPVITTLHTVLPGPNESLKKVTKGVIEKSTLVVVMSRTAMSILENDYDTSPEKIRFIPHGVPEFLPKERTIEKDRKLLLTFGLLGDVKGIEYVIDAMPGIIKKHPDVVYYIVGETHPVILKQDGERYREMLLEKVKANGLEQHVKFQDKYVTKEELVEWLLSTDIYISPSLDPNQITSGTIAYALGCGKAIVSTPFLYAKEVLADERGMLVEFENSQSIAGAVNKILEDASLKKRLEDNAREFSKNMPWPKVAREYLELFSSL